MNQKILFNDDITFNKDRSAWCFSGMVAGQIITIYCHSKRLNNLQAIDATTQFDLEESVERWLAENELESTEIEINCDN
jgi:hypothetical protein